MSFGEGFIWAAFGLSMLPLVLLAPLMLFQIIGEEFPDEVEAMAKGAFRLFRPQQEISGWMHYRSSPDEILVNVPASDNAGRGDIVSVFAEGWPQYRVVARRGDGLACWHDLVEVVEIEPQEELTKRAIGRAYQDFLDSLRRDAEFARGVRS